MEAGSLIREAYREMRERDDEERYEISRSSDGSIQTRRKGGDTESRERQVSYTYRLSQVAEITGLTAPYIVNLINRHRIINPTRDAQYGSREVYAFTQEDVDTLKKVANGLSLGYSITEIAEILKHEDVYEQLVEPLITAQTQWLQERDELAWQEVVDTFTRFPSLDDKERWVLGLREHRLSLIECAAELGLESEKEVKELLDSAYRKIGEELFLILRRGKRDRPAA